MPKRPATASRRWRTYIGLDPGSKGGAAALRCTRGSVRQIYLLEFKEATNRDIGDWLRKFSEGEVVAALENVHSTPQMGVASAFKFGRNFGKLEGMLSMAAVVYDYVAPQAWQRSLGIAPRKRKGRGKTTDNQWKKSLKQRAEELFPAGYPTLDTADALLIAEYCRRKYEGIL